MSYLRSNMVDYVVKLISRGQERSVKAKKNIVASFAIKGLSIAISLVLVPLTIHYVDQTQYGIWLTLSSIIGWFGLFDIGFGNGLRNKFAEAVAKEEDELARIYVSTTYAIMSFIVAGLLLLFFVVNPFLNWAEILNTPAAMAGELSVLALIVFVFFCLQFVLNLVTTIITANQEPAKASLLNLLGSVVSLIAIFLLTRFTAGNLVYLGIAFGMAPVIVMAASSIWLYKGEYRRFAPSFDYVKFSYARDLMTLGVKFFILQIAAIVLYSTSNVIITQLFGPAEVTPYNIAYKYFNVVPMAMGIVMLPFWSAYTDAWYKKDIAWIRNSIKKLQMIWLVFTAGTLVMLAFADPIYALWVGEEIEVPFSVSVVLAIYVITYGWTTIYTMFLNGTGKIKLQLYISMIGMVLNIPLAIYLGKTIGIAGVILSTVVLGLINMVVEPIQTYKLINNQAKGIWGQ